MSEEEAQEQDEDISKAVPETSNLVNSIELPPQNFSIVKRHCNSIAPMQLENYLDLANFDEDEFDNMRTTRNCVPKLTATKSIQCINRACSSDRKSLLNEKFKLIGADLRKSLKNKIDGELKNHKSGNKGK